MGRNWLYAFFLVLCAGLCSQERMILGETSKPAHLSWRALYLPSGVDALCDVSTSPDPIKEGPLMFKLDLSLAPSGSRGILLIPLNADSGKSGLRIAANVGALKYIRLKLSLDQACDIVGVLLRNEKGQVQAWWARPALFGEIEDIRIQNRDYVRDVRSREWVSEPRQSSTLPSLGLAGIYIALPISGRTAGTAPNARLRSPNLSVGILSIGMSYDRASLEEDAELGK